MAAPWLTLALADALARSYVSKPESVQRAPEPEKPAEVRRKVVVIAPARCVKCGAKDFEPCRCSS